nr:crocetin glucosyltransferase 3-like [Setaria viridis]
MTIESRPFCFSESWPALKDNHQSNKAASPGGDWWRQDAAAGYLLEEPAQNFHEEDEQQRALSHCSPHIVLFPLLAHGHVSAFLHLASLLHTRRLGLDVTLVSTPRILGSLSIPSAPSPLHLHALSFSPAEHGLPDAYSLVDIQFGQFITFFQASKSLRPTFEEFISSIASRSLVYIVSDAFFRWTVDVARAGCVPRRVPPGRRVWQHRVLLRGEHLPHAHTMADEFPLPDFPDVMLHCTQIPRYMLAATGADPWTAFF